MKSFAEDLLEVNNRGLMPDYSDHVRILMKFWYERGIRAAQADYLERVELKRKVKEPVVKSERAEEIKRVVIDAKAKKK